LRRAAVRLTAPDVATVPNPHMTRSSPHGAAE